MPAMSPPAKGTYFVLTNRGEHGPYDRVQLSSCLRDGRIGAEDRVRNAFGRVLGTVSAVIAADQARHGTNVEPVPIPSVRAKAYQRAVDRLQRHRRLVLAGVILVILATVAITATLVVDLRP